MTATTTTTYIDSLEVVITSDSGYQGSKLAIKPISLKSRDRKFHVIQRLETKHPRTLGVNHVLLRVNLRCQHERKVIRARDWLDDQCSKYLVWKWPKKLIKRLIRPARTHSLQLFKHSYPLLNTSVASIKARAWNVYPRLFYFGAFITLSPLASLRVRQEWGK
jgi:phage terminase small subunit